jgi:tetratricopeptide (TPR) repeat protein/transcriptional regulator with XRE-family HTH domain
VLRVADDALTQMAASRRRLAEHRKALGLTQEELAELLSVERSTVVRWERGETRPLPRIRPRLARALHVSAGQLQELLGDARRDGAPGEGGRGRGRPVVPRELPGDVATFTGRAAELAALDRLLLGSTRGAGIRGATAAAVISAVSGTAGVGKTALAVHWAHHAASQFRDGQLYVNLRGYDPGQPMSATDALAGFLRSLGVPGQDIPQDGNERAARYRSLLAGKWMLVVLDNASSAEQVRPLLPGNPECAVVVTSRDSLAGLVARDGAGRIDLDLLPVDDAVTLLRELIGARVDAEPEAAVTLAELCARLPLALRVAGEMVIARPAVPLTEIAGELADQQRRLDLLDAGGDLHTAVRAVFSWSCRHLDDDTARAFRMAGLHPGPQFDPYAIAALTGSTLQQARRVLDALARAHLVQPAGSGRHALHDLLRAYARDLAASHDTADTRHQALTRLFDHYLHTAAVAMDTLHPAEQHRRPRIPPPGAPSPPLTNPARALAWLDAQRPCLVAFAQHSAEYGWPGHASRLSATLFRYLYVGSHCPEALTIHACAYRAARKTGDRAAEAQALIGLGATNQAQGSFQQASDNLRQALAAFEETADRAGQARALSNLGSLDYWRGSYRAAAEHLQRALALHRATGDRGGQARSLGNLGLVYESQGRYQQAASHHQQALDLSHETGNRNGEAVALSNLGSVCERQGCYQQAASYDEQALDLGRETGNRIVEAVALTNLGTVRERQGRYQQAIGLHQDALALARETGREFEAAVLNNLGQALLAGGEPGRARTQHASALDLAGQVGYKYEQGRAHDGLARASQARGDYGRAREQWRRALAIYLELGTPEADEVRARLAAISDV